MLERERVRKKRNRMPIQTTCLAALFVLGFTTVSVSQDRDAATLDVTQMISTDSDIPLDENWNLFEKMGLSAVP